MFSQGERRLQGGDQGPLRRTVHEPQSGGGCEPVSCSCCTFETDRYTLTREQQRGQGRDPRRAVGNLGVTCDSLRTYLVAVLPEALRITSVLGERMRCVPYVLHLRDPEKRKRHQESREDEKARQLSKLCLFAPGVRIASCKHGDRYLPQCHLVGTCQRNHKRVTEPRMRLSSPPCPGRTRKGPFRICCT